MKAFKHCFLSVLPILIIAAALQGCTELKSEGSATANSLPALHSTQQMQEMQDDILNAFPELEAVYDISSTGLPDSVDNYYLFQSYRMKGEDELFSGTLVNENWKESLKVEGVFEKGKIRQFNTWYPNGNRRSAMTVTTENPDVQYVTTNWSPSGILQAKYTDAAGEKYFNDGSLKEEWNARGATSYWPNGHKKSYLPLEDSTEADRFHGEARAWHQNGTLGVTGTYRFGKKDGDWVHRDSLGNLIKTVKYDRGKVDTTIVHKNS